MGLARWLGLGLALGVVTADLGGPCHRGAAVVLYNVQHRRRSSRCGDSGPRRAMSPRGSGGAIQSTAPSPIFLSSRYTVGSLNGALY
ncbi:hypothetical protein M885DRAFT_166482 [Pelagophyceae sp. CCMP2097]|nr:hypothetical protein M885DRAFT_166482 [Pelagophyceae sp. CCMP2097]